MINVLELSRLTFDVTQVNVYSVKGKSDFYKSKSKTNMTDDRYVRSFTFLVE